MFQWYQTGRLHPYSFPSTQKMYHNKYGIWKYPFQGVLSNAGAPEHYQSQGLNPWGSPMLAQPVLDLQKGCFHRHRGLDCHRRFQGGHYHFYQCWVFCYHQYIIHRLPLPQYPKAGYYLPACSYPDPQKRTLDHLLHSRSRWMGFPAGHFY